MQILDIQVQLAEGNFGAHHLCFSDPEKSNNTLPKLSVNLGRLTDLNARSNPVKLVAVRKITNFEPLSKTESAYNFEQLRNELRNFALLRHDNLLRMHACFAFRHSIYLITEYTGYGSTQDLINAFYRTGLPFTVTLYIFHGVVKALEYLHNNDILHGSLRAQHVLIHHSGQVRLAGFRYMRQMDGRRALYEYPGSRDPSGIYYYAPEVIAQNANGYALPSDVYQLAILVCYLCNGILSFEHFEPGRVLLEKMYNQKAFLMDHSTQHLYIHEFPDISAEVQERVYPMALHRLVAAMQNYQPVARPSIMQILESPLFFDNMGDLWKSVPSLLEPVSPAYVDQGEMETLERILIDMNAPDRNYFQSADDPVDEELQKDLDHRVYTWDFDV